MQKQKLPNNGGGAADGADKMAGNKLAEMAIDRANAVLAQMDNAEADAKRKAAEEALRRITEKNKVRKRTVCCGCCLDDEDDDD